MTITIELPEDVEAALRNQAQARGMALDAYLVQHLSQDAIEKPQHPHKRKSLAQLFNDSPMKGLELTFERSQDKGRPITL